MLSNQIFPLCDARIVISINVSTNAVRIVTKEAVPFGMIRKHYGQILSVSYIQDIMINAATIVFESPRDYIHRFD